MKKTLSLILALVLLITTAGTALAETIIIPSGTGSSTAYGPLSAYQPLNGAWGSGSPADATWTHGSWPTIPGAQWISTDVTTETPVGDSFRKFNTTINLCTGAYDVAVSVDATADNAEEVYFNGVFFGGDGEVQGAWTDNQEWNTIKNYSKPLGKVNQVVVDFIVRNYPAGTTPTSNPTGLLYKINVNYSCPPTAQITQPAANATVSGTVLFEAMYWDNDPLGVQWAIRPGSCTSGLKGVWGNVDGRSDPYTWETVTGGKKFQTSPDTTLWPNGTYCFVFNPTEGTGEGDIRLTQFNVVNNPKAPVASVGGPYTGSEGTAVSFSGSGTDENGDTLTYAWTFGDGGTGTGTNPSHTYADNGSFEVCLTVSDGALSNKQCTTATVANVAPTATFSVESPVDEGSNSTLTLGSATDPSSADITAGLQFAFDCGNGYGAFGASNTTECLFQDNDGNSVKGKIQDKDGGVTEYTGSVVANNVAPTVGAISAPIDPKAINTSISFSAMFTDPGVLDSHTALWDWGDGSTSAGTVTETNGSGSVADSHTYTAAGVYPVILTVTDKDGDSGTATYEYVVVFDPSAGFVTGGGWIDSPLGAYAADPDLGGRATFGFVSKYQKGANVPTGNTEFQFKAGNLNFKSTSYEWLVVAGSKAQFKGTGTINGESGYGFMLTAVDSSPDSFRIKIWNAAGTVYDNKMGVDDTSSDLTSLGGGSIVIHK